MSSSPLIYLSPLQFYLGMSNLHKAHDTEQNVEEHSCPFSIGCHTNWKHDLKTREDFRIHKNDQLYCDAPYQFISTAENYYHSMMI